MFQVKMFFGRVSLSVFRSLKAYGRLYSSSTKVTPVIKEAISEKICLRKPSLILNGQRSSEEQPLVLLFSWVNAPDKAVDSYCEVYHQRGWDVLTIQTKLRHLHKPRENAVHVGQDIMAFLTEHNLQHQRPVLVHTVSAGAYLYAIFTMELQKDPEKRPLLDLFRGHVFDSLVMGGLGPLCTGIAMIYTNHPLLQSVVRSFFLLLYIRLYDQEISEFYHAFNANLVKGPVLFFYSLDDPISDHESMKHLIDQWSQGGSHDVKSKSWNSSPHAGHLRVHREEYLETLGMFIETLNMK